jgi:hypothetical protein
MWCSFPSAAEDRPRNKGDPCASRPCPRVPIRQAWRNRSGPTSPTRSPRRRSIDAPPNSRTRLVLRRCKLSEASNPAVSAIVSIFAAVCPILLADVHGRRPFALSGRSISVTGDCERSTSNALEKTSSIRAVTMTARNRRSIRVKRWPPASFHVGRG